MPSNDTEAQDPATFVSLTHRLAADYESRALREEWLAKLKTLGAAELTLAIGSLVAEGNFAPRMKALREAVISEVERKNAEHIANTMEHLDNSAKFLTYASLALTIVGTILAAIQVL